MVELAVVGTNEQIMNATIAAIVDEFEIRMRSIYQDRLVRLVLFGSQARGDAKPDSDIDLLVVLRGEVRPGAEISRTGSAAAALSLKHDVVISCTFISEDRYSEEHSPLIENIHREGIAV
jgi:predicted nucleotidyltransferase